MGYYNIYNFPKRPQVNRIDAMKTVLKNSFFSHEKKSLFILAFLHLFSKQTLKLEATKI